MTSASLIVTSHRPPPNCGPLAAANPLLLLQCCPCRSGFFCARAQADTNARGGASQPTPAPSLGLRPMALTVPLKPGQPITPKLIAWAKAAALDYDRNNPIASRVGSCLTLNNGGRRVPSSRVQNLLDPLPNPRHVHDLPFSAEG